MYLDRGLQDQLQRSLESSALVILEGARATGKTRLVEYAIERGWLSELRSFLDPAELNAARAAPRDYVRGLPHGTAIDEAQLCEEILLPVKERIEQSQAGDLLLTGSTRLRRDALGGSDPLAGRVGSPLHLGPLTIGERSGKPTQLVEQLFDDDPASIQVGAPVTRTDLVRLVQEPGLPGLFASDQSADRNDRARAYLNQVTSLSSFASVDVQRVNQLARYLAGRTSTLVNISEFGSDVELARPSVEKYLARLEEALVILRLQGWRRSKDKSETDRSKIHFFDAGIACAVARMRPSQEEQDLGRLAETLLVTDLVRQSRWLPDPPSCYHWRRSDHHEVDLILEWSDGRAVCVEVKVAESVTKKDFRGIDAFRERHGESFHRGFVFYSGSKVQPFGEGRWAMPFSALRPAMVADPKSAIRAESSVSRESTQDLWTRVLRQLIAMTRAATVEWDYTGRPHTYTASTGSGAITIATQLAGVEVHNRIVLSMDDAVGKRISFLEVEQQSGNQALYGLAKELAELIATTPTRASSVADNILGDLAE